MGAQAVRLSNVDIDNALKNKEFEVLFQPIFDLGNGALARMESFVRWRHASLGLLPPGAFISFFESQGRMSELTRYVLNESLSEYRQWRGSSAPGFSINLALSDLSDDAFAAHFEVMLRDCGFPAELITLECPMPPVDQPMAAATANIERLAETGARLAIEVRGRANDFLRTADPFPFDEIKTGGAAILRFARTVRGPGLSAISELLEIAAKANAAITAVGVEDQASLSALRGLGFAAAQGNHLARVGDLKSFTPSRVNEVRALLGLEPLATNDLHALFRVAAPAVQTAPALESKPATVAAPQGDALVERLAARIARQDGAEEAAAPKEQVVGPPPSGVDPARAAARAAKAAAIARAKKRARDAREKPREPAARQLQERLSRAFGGVEADKSVSVSESAGKDEFDIGEAQASPQTAENLESARQTASSDLIPPAIQASAGAESPGFATSLAVGPVRAFFRPGMRLGVVGSTPPAPRLREGPRPRGAAPAQTPPTAATLGTAFAPPASDAANSPSSSSSPPAAAQAVEGPRGLSAEKGQARAALADADSVSEAAPVAAPTVEPAAFGAVVEPAATQPAEAKKRTRKGFLQRTVIPYPTHFWPTSWRRAWKRRGAAIEARKAAE